MKTKDQNKSVVPAVVAKLESTGKFKIYLHEARDLQEILEKWIEKAAIEMLESVCKYSKIYIVDIENGTFGICISFLGGYDEDDPHYIFDLDDLINNVTENSICWSIDSTRNFRNKLADAIKKLDEWLADDEEREHSE